MKHLMSQRLAVFAAAMLLAITTTAHAQSSQPSLEALSKDPDLFLRWARKALDWDDPAEPAKIVGPIYFVGTKGLGSFLIKGSEGHVLLYTGMPGSGPLIEKSITKLGFKLNDVKLILTGHGHIDHVGGHAYLKKASSAKIAMMREEKELFESGGKLDFHYGGSKSFAFESVKVDTIFRDGDEIKLGDITITAMLTPGHTKGSTTYVTKVSDGGKMYTVVFPDGTGVNPGYRLSVRPSYPGIADDYRRTFRILEGLKPDIWLTPHNEVYDLKDKLAKAKKQGVAAWVDLDGYKTFVNRQKDRFESALRREKIFREADTIAPVTVHNFVRAETDRYFADGVKNNGLGKLAHRRQFAAIDKQDIVRMNRDTLYSSAVFDLDAAKVTITLPDVGKRYMALQVINQDHYTTDVLYAPSKKTFTKDNVGTRYVYFIIRTLADPSNPADVKEANTQQDAIKLEQDSVGTFEVPNWDQVSLKKLRDALDVLGSTVESGKGAMFGAKKEVDPVLHLIGTAVGWGGNPPNAAVYDSVVPKQNDGKTAYTLTVKDVPVDGFWSITVYNAKGFMEKNDLDRYSLNNLTAKPNQNGSYTIRFGGKKDEPNYLPIVPGWNYTVRLYRPRKEILGGTWKFPEATPVK